MATDRLSQLEELLKEDPRDSFLQYGIALEYAKKGDVPEAIARIEKLLSEKPDYLGAYYQLGQYYEVEGNNEEAIDIYKKGIILAQKTGNTKTMNELREAMQQIES
ncbi:MAG: tetratricopeptide repeat protein [Bacteroidetes bacterium]|jgi:tetratricopeptide (TPR) repeat protein|nr:tetratricopeptide repeat protein [Bacteroidota bacterium]